MTWKFHCSRDLPPSQSNCLGEREGEEEEENECRCSRVSPSRRQLTPLTNRPQTPMTQTMLKTAEPTIVPTPTSPFATKIPADVQRRVVSTVVLRQTGDKKQALSLPMMAVKSSGDDEPPAMKVAPATSSSSPNLYEHRKKRATHE